MNTQTTSKNFKKQLPSASVLKLFHKDLPLCGDPPNAFLSLPDEIVYYIVSVVRNTPCKPPEISSAEWEQVIHLLRPHGILSLLRFNLRSWPEISRPPPEIIAKLDQYFLMGVKQNLLIGSQIRTVLDKIQDAKIPVILLKGQALANTIYPNPVLRQSDDIDLLVKPEHVDDCHAILTNLGYTCPFRSYTKNGRGDYHDCYYPPETGVNIEIHWSLSCTYNLFPEGWLDDVFSRKIPVHFSDITGSTLNPQDHLLYLMFHNIFQHPCVRIDWIYDMSLIMDSIKNPEDWQELLEQSRKACMLIPMRLAITAASLWYGIENPSGFDLSSPPSPSLKEKGLWAHSKKRHESVISNIYLKFQGQHGMIEKLKFCFFFIFPPIQNLDKHRKSTSMIDIPLAYIRRWFSILKY